MADQITAQEKVGDIVTRLPQASEIFRAHNIDFCCGGNRLLADALGEQGLNEAEILSKLNELDQKNQELNSKPVNWEEESLTKLLDYIVSKHHSFLQKNLPRLSELTTLIFRVHGANHQELARVHRLFHNLKLELEQHLVKEEEVLFPMLKEYEESPSAANREKIVLVIDELENEHDAAGHILKELRKVTGRYEIPADVCTSYAATYQLMEELEGDIFQHIHLENNVLFPMLERKFKGNI